MNPSSERWKEITPSQYPWEQEALAFIREGLPDADPVRAWSNFEFIAEDGSINEVDLLVLTSKGFFLVEIKSWPGNTKASTGQWTVHGDGPIRVRDNPLLLANRKAKKLASMLRAKKVLFPFLRPLIFLSHADAKAHIDPSLREAVFLRDRDATESAPARAGIRGALLQLAHGDLANPHRFRIDRPLARALVFAMEKLGVRPSQALLRVGDYELQEQLLDGPSYQDFAARHVSMKNVVRRIRIYGVARAATAEERQTLLRAARREFELLEGIKHAGILPVNDFREHETGPALVFEHDPKAVRLDQFLAERGTQLSIDERLDLLRQIAEAVRYAHEKKLVHRALSPLSVLVSATDGRPRAVLFNWQTAARDLGSGRGTSAGRTFTEHVGQLVEDAATVYMAPEVWTDPEASGETLDVFGLGAIAYHLFTGQPPAASATELIERLRASQGLDPVDALNGAVEELRTLVRWSTQPDVSLRVDSVKGFLDLLNDVEEKLTRPAPDAGVVSEPTEAKAGDLLDGGLRVIKRLGKGSCAVAFLVEKDGREMVLKLALGPDHDDRLRDEAAVIEQLRHARIVALIERVQIGERTGLLLEKAGDSTLAERLRQDGRLTIDWLGRFGEDLLDAVRFLEEKGIPHRDIKPDNLGVGEVGRDRFKHLVLFDFSLSRTPAERIRAGTAPYLEPFLALRRPARWDLHAERFATAVTLYEMATATLPRWGDGRSDPAAIPDEVTVESDLFDGGVRDPLTAFFRKALRRVVKERFDTAEDMLRAWRRVFERIDQKTTQTDEAGEQSAAELLAGAALDTPISLLGLSTRAVNALERANVMSVRDLVQILPARVSHMRGVGNQTRLELWETIRVLAERFPRAEQEAALAPTAHGDAPSDEPFVSSVDLLVRQLLPARPQANATAETPALRLLLGLEEEISRGPGDWPSQTEVAARLDVTRARVGQLAAKARERWRRNPSLTALREEIVVLLRGEGGVMSAAELAGVLLAARGSTHGEPLRSRYAAAVARAATEAERSLAAPRWIMRRSGESVLLALDLPAEGLDGQALADWAETLGKRADALAVSDPLPGTQRIVEELSAVRRPNGALPVAPQRLVRLAAAASERAAVSNLLELYPRSMDATRALRLAQGALLGARELAPDQLQARIAARYPEAAPLPPRPRLDEILRDAGFGWTWAPEACDGRGGYRAPTAGIGALSSGSTSLAREHTVAVPSIDHDPRVGEARAFEEKLQRAARDGAWLVLAVAPAHLEQVERELVRRFPVDLRSLEALLLGAMKDAALQAGADWNVVLRADAADPTTRDGLNLRGLVDRVLPRVERELAVSSKTLLLTRPGLIARYDRMSLFERLRDRVGRLAAPGEEPLFGAWLIVPCSDQSPAPVVDGKPVPVVTPAEWARVPEAWIANRHRGGSSGENP